MKRRFLAVLLLMGSSIAQVKQSTVSELATLAAKKHLHWKVVCMADTNESGPSMDYLGYAEIPGHSSLVPIEEGGQPQWIVFGATQEEAARNLIQALKGPANSYPQHAVKNHRNHKTCPPPIEGGGV